eukprot:11174522-Lingulodinium_polyedra.AAC.1
MKSGIMDKYPWLRSHFEEAMDRPHKTADPVNRRKEARVHPDMQENVDEQAVASVLEEIRAEWERGGQAEDLCSFRVVYRGGRWTAGQKGMPWDSVRG